ncbi:MAG TPA: nicotinate-nucleotide diphosphorylase, partial [candidate division Zixibacteria bacterium]|nr:nicotinate-nucleotide diphosphorylase [candidate division Zixibacteria bacterium]
MPNIDYDFIARVLAEDLGEGDLTSKALGISERKVKAILWAKRRGVLAGRRLFQAFFDYFENGCRFRWFVQEG